MPKSKGTRPYAVRIAEIDSQLEILSAKRERLELLQLAQRARRNGQEPKGRALRAMVDAGLMAKANDLAEELRPIIATAEDLATAEEAPALQVSVEDEGE